VGRISFISTVFHQNVGHYSPCMIHSGQYPMPATYQIDSVHWTSIQNSC